MNKNDWVGAFIGYSTAITAFLFVALIIAEVRAECISSATNACTTGQRVCLGSCQSTDTDNSCSCRKDPDQPVFGSCSCSTKTD